MLAILSRLLLRLHVYRAGRTFTSVQHRAYIYGGGTTAEKQNNGTGYLDFPTIGGLSTLNINGFNSPLGPWAADRRQCRKYCISQSGTCKMLK